MTKLAHRPFAALGGEGTTPTPPPESRAPARAVVRIERKGRRGKGVTIVEQLGLAPAELELWQRDLKTTLGCGGAVEGDALVVQGDQRERVREWLEKRGVRRISGY